MPVVQLCENLLKKIDGMAAVTDVPKKTSHLPKPEKLDWIIEGSDKKNIEDASAFFDSAAKTLDYQVYRYLLLFFLPLFSLMYPKIHSLKYSSILFSYLLIFLLTKIH